MGPAKKLVGGLFGGEKPKPVAPVQVPTRAKSAREINAASEEEKQRRKKQVGRASTVLSNRGGILGDDGAQTGTRSLLG